MQHQFGQNIFIFLLQGHDTTTVGFSYLLLTLANEPKWQVRVVNYIDEIREIFISERNST